MNQLRSELLELDCFDYISDENLSLETNQLIEESNLSIQEYHNLNEAYNKVNILEYYTGLAVKKESLNEFESNLFKLGTETILEELGQDNGIALYDVNNKVSIEELKDTVSDIWTKIKKASIRIDASTTVWFAKLYKTCKMWKMALEKMSEKINSMSTDKPKNEEFKLYVGKLLTVGMEFSDLEKARENLLSEMDSFIVKKDMSNLILKTIASYEKVKVSDLSFKDIEIISNSLDENIKNIMNLSKTKGSGTIPKNIQKNGYSVKKHGHLLFNKCLYSIYPEGGFRIKNKEDMPLLLKKIDNSSIEISDYMPDKKSFLKFVKSSPLKKEFLQKWINELIKLVDIIINYYENYKMIKIIKDTVIKKADEFSKSISVFKGENINNELTKIIFSTSKRLNDFLNHPIKEIVTLALNTMTNTYFILSSCVNQYEQKK